MNPSLRNFALLVITVLLLFSLFTLFQKPVRRAAGPDVAFSQFLNEIDQGRVRDVLVQGLEVLGTYTDGRVFQTYAPNEQSWMQRLYAKNVAITIRPQQNDAPQLTSLLVSLLPFIAFIGAWILLSWQIQRAGKAAPFPNEIDALKRRVDELQKRLDQMSDKDKT